MGSSNDYTLYDFTSCLSFLCFTLIVCIFIIIEESVDQKSTRSTRTEEEHLPRDTPDWDQPWPVLSPHEMSPPHSSWRATPGLPPPEPCRSPQRRQSHRSNQ